MPEPASVRIEDLLAHSGWIRALAAVLARDPAAADDLVQDTWVAAMEHPPGDEGPVRPWLAAVLRNFRRQGLRETGRRERREEAVARPERDSLPSPDQLAARLETARRLATLVAGLEEPYRSTVLLRFFEGISSAEIARRQGTPEGTVRWRLKRALDMLRERLDRESGGDRTVWMAAVLPLLRVAPVSPAATPAGAGTAATTGGALAMGTATKTGIAAAVVLLAAGLFWNGVRSSGPGGEAVAPAPGLPAIPSTAPDHGESARGPAIPAEDPSGPAGGTPPPPPVTASAEVVQSRVIGRAVTESGDPIPGARLSVRIRDGDVIAESAAAGGFRILRGGDVIAESGADGGFRLVVELPSLDQWWNQPSGPVFPTTLVVSAAGRATVVRSLKLLADKDLPLGDIVLQPGGSIAGRVVNADGAPVSGAWVGIEDTDKAGAPADERRLFAREALTRGPVATTDATGAYLLDGVSVGTVRLWSGTRGYRAGRSDPVEVAAGAEARVDIRIEPERIEDRVEGRVLAPDGSALTNNLQFFAQAQAPGRLTTQRVEAGDDGSFSIPADYQGTFYLLAEDPYRRWGAAFLGPLSPGERDITARFPQARTVALSVKSHGGEPVTSWHAYLTPGTVRFSLSFYGVRPGDHPGGSAEFLAPGFPFTVEVVAEGFSRTTLGPFDPLSGPETIECVLAPAGGVRGRVLTGGRPVAGARVVAQRVVEPGQKSVRDGLPLRLYPDAEGEGCAGKDGEFSLPLRRAGQYMIRAEADGFAPGETGPVAFDPAGSADGIEVRLGTGGSIEGRVVVAPGRSPEGIIVAAHRGGGHPRSIRVGKDGRYRFVELVPGPWILQEHDRMVPANDSTSYGPGASEFRWSCTVEEGRTVAFDLDLTGAGAAVLLGRLSTGESAGAAGWTAGLSSAADEIPRAVTGAVTLGMDGAFTLPAAAPGSWRLVLTAPDGVLRILDTVDLREGETGWTLDLTFGRVEGRVDASLGPWSCLWEGAAARWAIAELHPGPDGRFSIQRMPAGRARLVLRDPRSRPADPDPRRWPARREFDVPAGSSVSVD